MVDTPVFFYCAVYNKSKLFVPFRQCALLIIGKSGDCLCYANIVSQVGSCGDGLQKKLKIKRGKELCSKLLR